MQHAALPHRSPAHVYTGCCKDEEEEEERDRDATCHSSCRRKDNNTMVFCFFSRAKVPAGR